MIFVIWSDYDHSAAIESFTDEEEYKAETFTASLIVKQEKNEYGTRVKAIIKGSILDFKIVEVTKSIMFLT